MGQHGLAPAILLAQVHTDPRDRSSLGRGLGYDLLRRCWSLLSPGPPTSQQFTTPFAPPIPGSTPSPCRGIGKVPQGGVSAAGTGYSWAQQCRKTCTLFGLMPSLNLNGAILGVGAGQLCGGVVTLPCSRHVAIRVQLCPHADFLLDLSAPEGLPTITGASGWDTWALCCCKVLYRSFATACNSTYQ